jgi:hypothetical protein
MQGALNWCRKIGLSVNGDKTTMVLFTNNRMIGGLYNPRLFRTALRMTEQVKYLGVILDKKLDSKAHLENRIRKACIAYWQCRRAVEKAIHFRSEAHFFVCFASMVEENGAEKCSEMALLLTADDVFGNNWWYAFKTNVCFRVYVNVATFTFAHKTKG